MAAPEFRVELAASATSGIFRLDSSLLDGVDVLADALGYTWTDVTDWVMGETRLSFNRGSNGTDGPWLRYQMGSASFSLDNRDGDFDAIVAAGGSTYGNSTYGGSTYGPPEPGSVEFTSFKPGTPCRITATLDGVTETIWLGRVDRWQPRYTADLDAWVEVNAVDGVSDLRAADLPMLATPVGGGDTTAERIDRILDSVNWPPELRDLDRTARNTMQATTLAQPAWQQILLTADSDAGFVWVDRSGRVVFRNRNALSVAPNLVLDMTSGAGVKFSAFEPSLDRDRIINVAKIGRKDGVEQQVLHTASMAEFGARTYDRTDLICETDAQAQEVAQWVILTSASLRYRIDGVTIQPLPTDPNDEWWQLLRLEFGDRVRVIQRTVAGAEFAVDGYVRSVQWDVHPALGEFTLSVGLQSAMDYGTPFQLDSSLLDGDHVLTA